MAAQDVTKEVGRTLSQQEGETGSSVPTQAHGEQARDRVPLGCGQGGMTAGDGLKPAPTLEQERRAWLKPGLHKTERVCEGISMLTNSKGRA